MLSNIRYILWLRDIHKWVFTTPWRTVNPQKISNKVFPFRDVCSEFDNVLFAELCVDYGRWWFIHTWLISSENTDFAFMPMNNYFGAKIWISIFEFSRQKRLLYYLGECIFWIFWDDHDVGDLRSFSCWFYLWPHTVACSSFWPSLRQVHQFGLGLRKLETPWCELLGRRDWLSLHSYGNDGDVPYHPYTRTS